MARMFRTKSGEEWELSDEKYDKLKRDFKTKDVDKVLYSMRVWLNMHPRYTMRGMWTAIRTRLARSPDVEHKYSASHTKFEPCPPPPTKQEREDGWERTKKRLQKMGILK